MADIKSFTICVADDNQAIDIYVSEYNNVPRIPLVIGTDRFNLNSNIPSIREYVKEMVARGYNRVVCLNNNLVIYKELINDLNHIDGIEVIVR